MHGDASGHVADDPVGIAACVGATWIGAGVPGTVELLRRSLAPGGMMLIGEPYWRRAPMDQATVNACHVARKDDLLPLPELLEQFRDLRCDVGRAPGLVHERQNPGELSLTGVLCVADVGFEPT
ncbi:hypothetical protein [Rhodococcus opacus]|uniref:hypothetical protein n=1 Tax=Rhodococcus opacus TaxID=37919 RepID=UPI000FFC56F2|nr:hypothetical protein [Rhodococcus opacus]